jgi:two-component system chemotaxis sensor kinase CheA
MSIDISQFHQVFFEESFEGLDIMETGLLGLELGSVDFEAINTIFRAAHSIKGGAGSFGFSDISDFTHGMETLLDEWRSGKREATQAAVDILLQCVDGLREMMAAARNGDKYDAERINILRQQVQNMLQNAEQNTQALVPASTAADSDDTKNIPSQEIGGWRIHFKPFAYLLKTGNEPIRIIRELATFGELQVEADISNLPSFEQIDPEEVHIAWDLNLISSVSRIQIEEVFSWVEDDCDLTIEQIENRSKDTSHLNQGVQPKPQDQASTTENTATNIVQIKVQTENIKERPAADQKKSSATTESTSIRVNTDKIDALINLVGELVITQSILSQFSGEVLPNDLDILRDGLSQLSRNTRELQESVLRIRMFPISHSFNRFPRLVHDLSSKLGKKIELKMSGEQTELDKTVMEKISDPLVHLVRNSLDHGIETPDIRKERGKPETGTLGLNAYHEGGNIVIEITDDGAGLNKERILKRAKERGLVGENESLTDDKIHELIFQPGFSTVEIVSDVSGRGVGMDVVRRNIQDMSGVVEIKSREGHGTTFTIRLPLTLAIVDGQLVRVGRHIYVIPLVSIIESLQVDRKMVNSLAGRVELYKLRNDYLPIIRLYKAFNIVSEHTQLDKGLLVVVEGGGQKAGVFVDELLAQQQVVVKSMETNYQRVPGISGATILGDGKVALILDIPRLLSLSDQVTQMHNLLLDDNAQSRAA